MNIIKKRPVRTESNKLIDCTVPLETIQQSPPFSTSQIDRRVVILNI